MPKTELLVVFDLRCLQDPNYRDRGVGRLSSNLVHSIDRLRESFDVETIGIVDHTLPPLEERLRSLVHHIQKSGYLPVTGKRTVFIELSPMTHDPLFIGRIVNDPSIFKIAIIYDFIPLLEPERYLPSAPSRINYNTQLIWLSRYDHFFPISQYSTAELCRILNIPGDRITQTAAPVDCSFEKEITSRSTTDLPGKYVLACGGAEPRKNIECVLEAHAKSAALQQASVSLVVTGNYPAEWQSRLRDLYIHSGGRSELLIFSGFVSQDELVLIYRRALCAVVAARMEGFSIPVVEAMAANIPVIASDIPAHRELVHRDDLMFALSDVGRVGNLLESLVSDSDFRSAIQKEQSGRWQQFRATTVASEFWSGVKRAIGQDDVKSGAVLRSARPKIAFLSPMPPDPSGIADYSAATVKELGKLAEVHVFSKHIPTVNAEGAYRNHQITEFPCISSTFDRVVGVIGNSHFHLEIFHLLERYGGACIEHDNRLLGFYSVLLGPERAKNVAQRELNRLVTDAELNSWLGDESQLKATFLGEIAAWASPMFVHSRVIAQIVEERFEKKPIYLPFSIYRSWDADPTDSDLKKHARGRLGINASDFIIISLGFVHSNKAAEECIWAVDLLRSWNIPAKLYFVGDFAGPEIHFRSLVSQLGLTEHIIFASGFVNETQYRDYLVAADAAVQLRTHLFGGLSGALLDCIAVGLPSVANDDLALAMEAPSYVSTIPDNPSPVLIAEALVTIREKGINRASFNDERQVYCQIHSFESYAEQLCQGLTLKV